MADSDSDIGQPGFPQRPDGEGDHLGIGRRPSCAKQFDADLSELTAAISVGLLS